MQKYERHGASRKYLVYLITRRGEKKLGVKKKRTKFKITYIFENFGEKISCMLKYIYIYISNGKEYWKQSSAKFLMNIQESCRTCNCQKVEDGETRKGKTEFDAWQRDRKISTGIRGGTFAKTLLHFWSASRHTLPE